MADLHSSATVDTSATWREATCQSHVQGKPKGNSLQNRLVLVTPTQPTLLARLQRVFACLHTAHLVQAPEDMLL